MTTTATNINWSELPPELIVVISHSLVTIADYLRFRSVCSAWRSAASPNPRHLPIQSPSLAFPSHPHHSFKILTFPNSTPHSLPFLPTSDHHQLVGSSDGLLVLRRSSSPSVGDGDIFLFNPLTLSHTRLPSLKTFPLAPFFIKKIVLSPSIPPAGPTSAVAVLGCSNELALCRIGDVDSSWIRIQWTSSFHDALFFKGRFFIADGFRSIFVLDFDAGGLTEVARVQIARTPPFIGRGEKCYLAESEGNLLLVVRHLSRVGIQGQRDAVVTKGFEVFKIVKIADSGGGGGGGTSIWLELKSFGDQILFLGLNRSIVMSGDECPGFRRNCIYFLDDRLNSMGDLTQHVCDAGVFDMSDRSIELLQYDHDVGDSSSISGCRSSAVWFTPSLC